VIIPDVNVLVAAHREDSPHHSTVTAWLRAIPVDEVLAVPAATMVGFLRVVTHPRIYPHPTPVAIALAFVDRLRLHPAYRPCEPGPEHWQILGRLVLEHGLTGNDLPDAHLAALSLAHGATLATFDHGFARFDGLDLIAPG